MEKKLTLETVVGVCFDFGHFSGDQSAGNYQYDHR